MKVIKFQKPAGAVKAPAGDLQQSGSGSDFLELIGIHEVHRGPISDLNHKKPVVGVKVGLKVIPKLDSGPRAG